MKTSKNLGIYYLLFTKICLPKLRIRKRHSFASIIFCKFSPSHFGKSGKITTVQPRCV